MIGFCSSVISGIPSTKADHHKNKNAPETPRHFLSNESRLKF